jgi:hypothetical protein
VQFDTMGSPMQLGSLDGVPAMQTDSWRDEASTEEESSRGRSQSPLMGRHAKDKEEKNLLQ